MWKKDSGPYMQTVHFCFSLGGMIAPQVAEPFLAPENCLSLRDTMNVTLVKDSIPLVNSSNKNHRHLVITNSSEQSLLPNCTTAYEDTRVHYAYLISGALLAVTSVPFLFTVLFSSYTNNNSREEKRLTSTDQTGFHKLHLRLKVLILGFLSLLMIVYCGTEDTYAGFLMTFLITQLRWTKSQGAVATSIYWICFGVARLAGVLIVRLARTTTLIYIYSLSLVVSFTGLLVSTTLNIDSLIWVFVGMVGCSLSIIFAAIFTWTTECVTEVAGKISAMFMASASLGVILFPLLFGYMMKWLSPMWFLYLLLGQSIVWAILFIVTDMITRYLLRPAIDTFIPEVEPLNTSRMQANIK